eukprot:CAMPEP_0172450212 /NCGR_PEP_ID=MMETSP1065-20121228/8654_1 /TAXON_ID=265537 /ORGANISM="Amphiprora paludosa, Strain CCMP125" /LENGTH=399 /DNA_ID=CAMNT_0013201989 /DNA_START=333 /DNA_END=1532 /DNA_ORIENTATION=+
MHSTTTDRTPKKIKNQWYRVEVTIQRLEDMMHQPVETPEGADLSENHQDPTVHGATIAFGGCSKRNNIQVGSNSVCNQTGHLLVESESVSNSQGLDKITWRVEDRPHMSMSIPGAKIRPSPQDSPVNPAESSQSSNEDSQDKSPRDTANEDLPITVTYSNSDVSASSSGWSLLDTSDSQPDNVVEVLLRLKQSPQTMQSEAAVASCWDGVAYLIVPPKPGRHVVAVPVQIPKTSTQPRSANSSFLSQGNTPRTKLSPLQNATLHVTVTVAPTDDHPQNDSMTAASSHMTQSCSPPSPDGPLVDMMHQVGLDDDEPLVQKIRASEEKAQLDFQEERDAMKTSFASPEPQDKWTISYLWEILFQNCDFDNSCIGATRPQHDPDDIMVTDNSTIATRPSLGI